MRLQKESATSARETTVLTFIEPRDQTLDTTNTAYSLRYRSAVILLTTFAIHATSDNLTNHCI